MTTVIIPRTHDLGGGFQVRRAVPSLQARSVGPFVFVDHMGPAVFEPGRGIDVRPHPHIGLATVTYLWAGAIDHRDTLGSEQVIVPGDVNWMTSGRGIAHSERTPADARGRAHDLHGMQTWVALPKAFEEVAPEFHHHPAATLPQWRRDGAFVRVIAGRAFGEESPVRVFADTCNAAIDLAPDAQIALDDDYPERALYVLEGPLLRARTPLKAMLLGGEPLDAPRHMWWNFVSSSRERIEAAKQDWLDGKFGQVPGEEEFIPLPER
jgi:hypothetical protein